MNRSWMVTASLMCIGLVSGFLLTLALHRQIRPEPAVQTTIAPLNVPSAPVSRIEFDNIKNTLAEAETYFAKATAAHRITESPNHRITEGHARALLSEMQVYRNNESDLLQTIEQQKQALADKIDDLEAQIEQTLEQSAKNPNVYGYEQLNELNALLAYPHPLNHHQGLNNALAEQPQLGLPLVNLRFELMLQAEHYPNTSRVYDWINSVIATLPTESPTLVIDRIFCTEITCEVQAEVSKPSPYFDSWRWLLDQLASQPKVGIIQHAFNVEEDHRAYGLLMLEVGD